MKFSLTEKEIAEIAETVVRDVKMAAIKAQTISSRLNKASQNAVNAIDAEQFRKFASAANLYGPRAKIAYARMKRGEINSPESEVCDNCGS